MPRLLQTGGEPTTTQRIVHRDLRNRSSEILSEVAAGATYEVTNHGEVVAILSPLRVDASDMVASDRRLQQAARTVGLTVTAPGQGPGPGD